MNVLTIHVVLLILAVVLAALAGFGVGRDRPYLQLGWLAVACLAGAHLG